jgi:hypothetical protein
MREHGHPRLALDARHEPFAAARHDHVDRPLEPAEHRSDCGAVGGRHELDRMFGQAGDVEARRQASVDRGGAPMRVRAAAQDDGVPGLQAERAGIGGDVRAALEDDADHAKRRADALDLQPVGAVPLGDDRANRVGQIGDLFERARHRFDPRGVQRATIDHGRTRPARPHGANILGVGAEDLALPPAKLGGRGCEGSILRPGLGVRQLPGRGARPHADVAHQRRDRIPLAGRIIIALGVHRSALSRRPGPDNRRLSIEPRGVSLLLWKIRVGSADF